MWLYDGEPRRRSVLIRVLQRAPILLKRATSYAMARGNHLKRLWGAENPVTASQTADEVYFWNLDMYGPEFRHLQDARDVELWFRAHGFGEVVRCDRTTFGFGLTGTAGPRLRDGVDGEQLRRGDTTTSRT